MNDGIAPGKDPATQRGMDPLISILLLFFCGLGAVFLPDVMKTIGLVAAVVVSAIIGLSVSIWTLMARNKAGDTSLVIWAFNRLDTIRALTLVLVFGQWIFFDKTVSDQTWLIAAQLPFAYLLDMAFAWRRNGVYEFNFGPITMVATIHLFMWVSHDWFAIQFAMVLMAYSSQYLLTHQWIQGRWPRFSPTTFAIVAVSVICLFMGRSDITGGGAIATSLSLATYSVETLFLVLILLQFVLPIAWVAIGALLTFVGFSIVYTAMTGGIFFLDSSIPIGALLALTILVCDGRTAPMTRVGQCLMGLLYGTGVIGTYWLIWDYTGMPWAHGDLTYLSAILCIPLLNIAIPRVERVAELVRNMRTPIQINHSFLGFIPLLILVLGYMAIKPDRQPRIELVLDSWATTCRDTPSQCARFAAVWQRQCTDSKRDPLSDVCRPTAVSAYQQGCLRGVQADCARQGYLLYDEPSVSQRREGKSLLVKACKAGLYDVCNRFAQTLAKQEPKNIQLRRELARISCDGSNVHGCEIQGMLMYRNAKAPSDYRHASEKLFRACQKQLPLACTTLAEMLIIGQFGKKSLSRARILFTDACRGGYAPACARLKTLPKERSERRKRVP